MSNFSELCSATGMSPKHIAEAIGRNHRNLERMLTGADTVHDEVVGQLVQLLEDIDCEVPWIKKGGKPWEDEFSEVKRRYHVMKAAKKIALGRVE